MLYPRLPIPGRGLDRALHLSNLTALVVLGTAILALSACGTEPTGAGGSGGAGGGGMGGEYRLVAANNLGMHCVDREYSIFSMLPPFNTLQAQIIHAPQVGLPSVVEGGDLYLTFSPVADEKGSINSTSLGGKTDFWEHAPALFGVSLPEGQGLLGLHMPADAPEPGPQPFSYDDAAGAFLAAGIPITPIDDAGSLNSYPLLRVTVMSKDGTQSLAALDVVAPVSSETDCQTCHATGQIAAADDGIAWANDADLEVQTKKNILLLHDADQGTSLATQTPVLCASCHYDAALDLAGAGPQGEQVDNPTFSKVMHGFHAKLEDEGGSPLFPENGSAAQTCYSCHPGAVTKCYRGAMASAGIQCSGCHGGMSAVGGDHPLAIGGSMDGTNDMEERRPWVDLPRCQSCHTGDAVDRLEGAGTVPASDGIHLMQGWLTGDPAASPILATNKRFAEEENRPYQTSKGHGGVLCQGCHNSTHAEWPNADADANDNAAASALQGHAGPITECTACHAGGAPLGLDGPHGMHPVADAGWIAEHGHMYEHSLSACEPCHGADLEGTVLSRAAASRKLATEEGTVTFSKGQVIGCTHCHGKPD